MDHLLEHASFLTAVVFIDCLQALESGFNYYLTTVAGLLSKTAFEFSKVSKINNGTLVISVPDIVSVIEKGTLNILPVYKNLVTELALYKNAIMGQWKFIDI